MPSTSDRLEALATLLASEGVGTYRNTGAYLPNEFGYYLGRIPHDASQGVGLTEYVVADDPTAPESTVGIQFMIRGTNDSASVDDFAYALKNRLHGRGGFTLAGGRVRLAWLNSGSPLGWSNDQYENSQNYYLDLHDPTAFRP